MSGQDHSLPELPSSRGLTEGEPGRRHTLPPALDTSSRQQVTSPPPRLMLNRTAPVFLSSRAQSRRVSEYVRLSRSELEHKEQAMTSLRSVNISLQSKVRELEAHQQVAVMLTGVCRQLASSVGSTADDDIATETMADMLTTRVAALVKEHSQTYTQLCSVREELESVRGELAAAEVKMTSAQSQLRGLESVVSSKEALNQQLKVELESSQQSTARCTAMVQSLRQQLSSAERERDTTQSTRHTMQTEIGRLQQQLRDTESARQSVEEQLSSSREEHTILKERAEVADTAYDEVCGQLGELLMVDTGYYCDIDLIMEKVTALMQDNEALRLKLDTVTHSSRAVELDAKANRETILRLVSQSKRHEKEAQKVPALQDRVTALEEELACGQRERTSLLERLEATRSTVTALEREITAKTSSITGLQHEMQTITAECRQEQIDQQQYRDFYHDVSAAVSSSTQQQLGGTTRTTSSDVIAMINALHQGNPHLEAELRTSSAQLAALQARVDSSQLMVDRAEESVERERDRVRELEAQLSVAEGFRHQLDKQQQKTEMLYQRLGRALNLDNASCGILAGDIGEDAIIARAQQLGNMETQAVQEKQAAVYSLQRKLKSSRQALESRDLQVSLLQRKVCGLEDRMNDVVKKEAEMNTVLDKGRKMTRQIENLQSTVVQQRETITRLKKDSEGLDKLKDHCAQQEQQLAASSMELAQVQQARVQQAQQLAEIRQRAQLAASKEKGAIDKMEADLSSLRKEVEEGKERERQLMDIKTAVETIVTSQPVADQQGTGIIGQLEQLLASRLTYQTRAHDLEASLKELERGFRTSYQDALSTLAASHQ